LFTPYGFERPQNHPNPFNPAPLFNTGCQRSAVSLKVYNNLGQKVATLVDGEQKAGYKIIRWDANAFSSGIYFCRLEVRRLKAESQKPK